jgi:hypothetical protein
VLAPELGIAQLAGPQARPQFALDVGLVAPKASGIGSKR